eukprot:1256219-Pyramimonas_sp.AAC.1
MPPPPRLGTRAHCCQTYLFLSCSVAEAEAKGTDVAGGLVVVGVVVGGRKRDPLCFGVGPRMGLRASSGVPIGQCCPVQCATVAAQFRMEFAGRCVYARLPLR